MSRDILRIAAWYGGIAGLVEGAAFLLLQQLNGLNWNRAKIPVALEILWVAPLFDVLIFVFVGLVLAGAARLLPRHVTVSRVVLFFTFLTCCDWLALSGHLYPYAFVVLALGLAVAFNRWFRRHEAILLRYARLSLPAVVICIGVLLIAVELGQYVRERIVTARLPAAAPGAPNVLVIVVDTLRADHLSTYGYARATSPNLDRIAHEGVVFDNAFSTSSWTLPSHASLVTGRYPYEHGSEKLPLNDRYPTIGEALSARGYRTGAFSGNVFFFNRRQGFGRGFVHFEDYFHSPTDMAARTLYGRLLTKYIVPSFGFVDVVGRKRAPEINHAIMRWLDRSPEKPYFVFVNYMDVHDPYLPPQPFRHAFATAANVGGLLSSDQDDFPHLTDEQLQSEVDAYDGAIAYTDHHIGELLHELEQRGLARNTFVIITSDHGESFGEHGLFLHQSALYRELIRVPLIIFRPDYVPAGVRVPRPVSNSSLPATIMALVGNVDPVPFPQPSLTQLWEDPTAGANWPTPLAELARLSFGARERPARYGAMKSLISPEWQYIVHDKFGTELYDWKSDPREEHSLAQQPELQATLERLQLQLLEAFPHPPS